MKKFVALALTLTLALCAFAIPTFAAPADQSHDVDVTVNTGVGGLETVYKVDVVWDDLAFTYTFGEGAAEWNPNSHAYETKQAEGTVGSWNKTTANITVTNHSNAALNVTATKADVANTGVTFEFTNDALALATAEGTAVDAAPSGTIACAVTGVPTSKANFKLSTITLAFN